VLGENGPLGFNILWGHNYAFDQCYVWQCVQTFVHVKCVLCNAMQMLLPLSLFFKMCYVLTRAFYRRIKSRCMWLNVKQCTPSSTGRHSMYTASRQSSSAYGCNRPKSSIRATALGSLSETWYSDLQLLESGSEKNPPDSDQRDI
jgi:hypothetical protein